MKLYFQLFHFIVIAKLIFIEFSYLLLRLFKIFLQILQLLLLRILGIDIKSLAKKTQLVTESFCFLLPIILLDYLIANGNQFFILFTKFVLTKSQVFFQALYFSYLLQNTHSLRLIVVSSSKNSIRAVNIAVKGDAPHANSWVICYFFGCFIIFAYKYITKDIFH